MSKSSGLIFARPSGGTVCEDGEVEIVVVRGEEDILTIVTPLGYVVRKSGNDYPGDPWHG